MKNNRMNLTPEAKEQEMRFAIRGCQRQPAFFFRQLPACGMSIKKYSDREQPKTRRMRKTKNNLKAKLKTLLETKGFGNEKQTSTRHKASKVTSRQSQISSSTVRSDCYGTQCVCVMDLGLSSEGEFI